MKKYKFIEEKEFLGTDGKKHILHRIQAIEEFWNAEEGESGGWIEKESNLSHDGNAWVKNDACVYGNARIEGNAVVSEQAQVYGNAIVSEQAEVYGNACVFGNACIDGNAKVYDDATVGEEARITSHARVHERAEVYGQAKICEFSNIWGGAYIDEKARVYGTATVGERAIVRGNAIIAGDTRLSGRIIVQGNAYMNTDNIWHTEGRLDYDACVEDENGLLVFKNIGEPHGVLCFYKGESGKLYASITHHFDEAYYVGEVKDWYDKVRKFYKGTMMEDILRLAMEIALLRL